MEHHHQDVKAMLRNLMWQRPSNQDVGGHGDPASNAGEPGEREKGSECTRGDSAGEQPRPREPLRPLREIGRICRLPIRAGAIRQVNVVTRQTVQKNGLVAAISSSARKTGNCATGC